MWRLAPWAVVLVSALSPTTARAETLEWARQLGTDKNDASHGVSADELGNVYISGFTWGDLGGTNAGEGDAFISKYDASGEFEWTQQLGTSSDDWSLDVSADGLGNVYISGGTGGSLEGTYAGGNADAFISKYNASGTCEWTRQLSTIGRDEGYGVAADGLGNVYISGYTWGSLGETNAGDGDAFISKYNANGEVEWTRQLGTSKEDRSYGVSADRLGNVYISGLTNGDLAGGTGGYYYDAFVSKYNASGTCEWTRRLGTSSHDISQAVSADGLGNVYISGVTEGSLEGNNAGGGDAFISKYDASGTLQWTRQFGTGSDDYSHGVSADRLGNVYVSGETKGHLEGTNAGGSDVFISKYDASGTLQWTRQLGTNRLDYSSGVSVDQLGNVYISGGTTGDLGGTNAGGTDAFVAKFMDSSEPLLADINDDGEVNGLDVDPFVNVLLSGPYQPEADMNEDHVVNGLDVGLFVAAVVAGGTQPIDEPSTILLALVALAVVGGWWKWKRTA